MDCCAFYRFKKLKYLGLFSKQFSNDDLNTSTSANVGLFDCTLLYVDYPSLVSLVSLCFLPAFCPHHLPARVIRRIPGAIDAASGRSDRRGDDCRDSRFVYTTGDRRRDDRSDCRGDDRPVYTPYEKLAATQWTNGRHAYRHRHGRGSSSSQLWQCDVWQCSAVMHPLSRGIVLRKVPCETNLIYDSVLSVFARALCTLGLCFYGFSQTPYRKDLQIYRSRYRMPIAHFRFLCTISGSGGTAYFSSTTDISLTVYAWKFRKRLFKFYTNLLSE